MNGTPDGFVRPDLADAQWDAQRRLDDLATQGVMAEVLFSNGVPFAAGRLDHAPDPDQTRAANMAYNRWLVASWPTSWPRRHTATSASPTSDYPHVEGTYVNPLGEDLPSVTPARAAQHLL